MDVIKLSKEGYREFKNIDLLLEGESIPEKIGYDLYNLTVSDHWMSRE